MRIDRTKCSVIVVFVTPGDEVVQWNGIRLRGRTFEEVYDIIFESKFDPQVELTVHRPVGNTQQRRNDAECIANTEGLAAKRCTGGLTDHSIITSRLAANLVHFSFTIWHLVATMLMIFLRINLPNFLQFKQY